MGCTGPRTAPRLTTADAMLELEAARERRRRHVNPDHYVLVEVEQMLPPLQEKRPRSLGILRTPRRRSQRVGSAGRVSSLTPSILAQIRNAAEECGTWKAVAKRVGVNPDTLNWWRRQGQVSFTLATPLRKGVAL